MKQTQKQTQRKSSDEDPIDSPPTGNGAQTLSNVDDILNEIDDVLEENAEEFVRGYVQKGGQ